MTSSKHNDLLYNAAIAGITAGVLGGKDYDQITAATLATTAGVAQQAAIAAAALEVDTLIPFDATLSVGSADGTMLVTMFAGSGTAAQILPVFSKSEALAALCESAFWGATINSPVASTYVNIAEGIALQYAATVLLLVAS